MIGIMNAITVRAAPDSTHRDPLTDRSPIKRRLKRFTPVPVVPETVLSDGRIVYDFSLYGPGIHPWASRRALEDMNRFAETRVSVLFIEETDDGVWVRSFCFRPPDMDDFIPHVKQATPPVNVKVWRRPSNNTPHVGASNVSVHPHAVLDFLAEML
jgi:hypothetical protein